MEITRSTADITLVRRSDDTELELFHLVSDDTAIHLSIDTRGIVCAETLNDAELQEQIIDDVNEDGYQVSRFSRRGKVYLEILGCYITDNRAINHIPA